MKKNKKHLSSHYGSDIMDSPVAIVIISILAILGGIFMILMQSSNKPISRADALSYSGSFEKYETGRNYCTLILEDGSSFDIYPHTESSEFREKMESLEKGTKLYISVNPNNSYVAEIRTDSEELLNFEASQAAIDSYDNGYIVIGGFMCVCGVLLIAYSIMRASNQKNEKERKKSRRLFSGKSLKLRSADEKAKSRILLTAKVNGYDICYRRVKNVNELIINGSVYDEIKAFIEFEHTLSALVDGHTVEAGLDSLSLSYIAFDGERIAEKKRIV